MGAEDGIPETTGGYDVNTTRRGFLRLIGIGAAVAAVVPKVEGHKLSKPEPLPELDASVMPDTSSEMDKMMELIGRQAAETIEQVRIAALRGNPSFLQYSRGSTSPELIKYESMVKL